LLIHNHPGGDPTPSLADIQMTLMKPEEVAAKIYDMIFNDKDYYNGQSIEFYNQ
jgi:DNA repair protein RadC